jgi:hypothetical protein
MCFRSLRQAVVAALTLLLAFYFMVGGLFRIISAVAIRQPQWGWSLFAGVVTLVPVCEVRDHPQAPLHQFQFPGRVEDSVCLHSVSPETGKGSLGWTDLDFMRRVQGAD